jgi:hypothetical protein
MKIRLATLWVLIFAGIGIIRAYTPGHEVLRYNVTYKWGLINKKAGDAVLTISPKGSGYRAELCAQSAPWADHIYRVRDTLISAMDSKLRPTLYEKRAHEDGKFSHDKIQYTRNGNNVNAHCTRYRDKKGEVSTSTIDLSGSGLSSDMLNVYFLIRNLDFESMSTGQSVTVTMFSGQRKEILYLTFAGIQDIKIDNNTYNCYCLKFRFTSDGQTKSSDNMTAWVTTSAKRIPVKIMGTLPVGKINVLYAGN